MSHAGRGLVGWSYVPRLKISHRLFAAHCVAAIIDPGRLLPRRSRPPVADVDLQPIAVMLQLVRPAWPRLGLLGESWPTRVDEFN